MDLIFYYIISYFRTFVIKVRFLLLRIQRFLFFIIDFLRFEENTGDLKDFSCWQYQALGSSDMSGFVRGRFSRRKRYHHVLAVTRKYIKVKGIGPKILTVVQMACVGET